MKKLFLVSVALATSGLCLSQEVGRVISATPIIGQVSSPRQVCTTEPMSGQAPRSGAGALMGAIAGGAIGNAIGGGAGTVAATMLGIIGGAAVGDRIEGEQTAQVENVQRCTTQSYYESQPVAYNVVYEYGGKQYSVQMPDNPGATVQLQVTPVGASTQTAAPAGQATYSRSSYTQPTYVQPTYVQPTYVQPGYVQPGYVQSGYAQPGYVVVSAPAYPVYYQPNYVVPLALGLGIGYLGGYGGHRHGRWR